MSTTRITEAVIAANACISYYTGEPLSEKTLAAIYEVILQDRECFEDSIEHKDYADSYQKYVDSEQS